MNYMIYGEDCRHGILAALLNNAGFTMQAPADLLILSPRESFCSHRGVLKEGCYIWGGPASDTPRLQTEGYKKMKQSENFRVKNSVYTAEGALSLAIEHTKKALCDSTVSVLGYGFLGKECTRLFAALGAAVTVYTENPKELAEAVLNGYEAKKLTELSDISGTLLLNTIPVTVLDTLPISASDKPALLIELASTPCLTDDIPGLTVLPAGALPSRFSPESAAGLIFDEIIYQLKKE